MKQFYKDLSDEKLVHGVKWSIYRGSLTNRKLIRIYPKFAGHDYCPLTAVAKLYGKKFRVGSWIFAAKFLGISHKRALKILSATDDGIGHSRVIRSKLLRATGLSDTKS